MVRHPRSEKNPDSPCRAEQRSVQESLSDSQQLSFAAECRRQSALAVSSDRADVNLAALMEQSLADLDGWES